MVDDFTKEQLKSGLTAYVQSITQPDRRAGHNMYVCPLCGSGSQSGAGHNGAFSIDPKTDYKTWKCFSCGESGDIFTLISLHEGLTDFTDQVKRAAEFAGVNLAAADFEEPVTATRKTTQQTEKKEEKPPFIGRYKQYVEDCAAAIGKTDYFKRRGFTDDTIKRFNLGFDDVKQAVVIPYGRNASYYITRSIEGKEFRKPKTEEAGAEPIYNVGALYQKKPCFVCESPIDAISIMQAGGNACSAIALGGTGSQKLIAQVKKEAPACMLILSFDNDEPGEKAAATAAKDLLEANIPFIKAAYSLDAYPHNKPRKDANDLLNADPAQLQADVINNADNAETEANAEKAAALEEHNKNNGAERLKAFEDGIKGASTDYIPTGFSELDKELDGGLYPGLYILGAISSLGKTTLLLQLADQIAESGRDVLYFSLEMAANELISKSISRHTYKLCNGKRENAKTARGITTVKRYANYSAEEKALIADAIRAYGAYAAHIYLYEGVGDIGVEEIKRIVAEHKALTGNTPLVFLDYLQILAPYDMRASDKQNTDKAVLELKRLSRDFNTSVFCISSFNRDNYTSAVNMTAFKESGAVEYGSDVLIGLQPQGMKPGYTKTEQKENARLVKDCKRSEDRDVELVILKNRNGRTGGKIGFVYHSLFNDFTQDYGFTPTDDAVPFEDEDDDFIPYGQAIDE